MRKVKVAAIQPGYISIPDQYSYMSDNYINNPGIITENYVKAQLEVTEKLLKKAGEDGCDIAVTCEDITGLTEYIVDISVKNIFPGLVELTYPLAENKLSDIARKYSMYVIGCYFKRFNGSIYNTAVLFGRKGQIIGEYKKTHLPPYEKWQCRNGPDIDVFDLDFGRIGVCICYDMMFPEFIQIQSLKGAEIIFHPTLGYGWYDEIGEATLRTRANDNSVYLVTSKNYSYNSAGKSSIVDFWGQILSQGGFYKDIVIEKDIDLELKKTQPEWHYSVQTSGISEVGIRKTLERRPELYSLITEALPEKYKELDNLKELDILKKIMSKECHW